jgi:serine/threonine-protein kinase
VRLPGLLVVAAIVLALGAATVGRPGTARAGAVAATWSSTTPRVTVPSVVGLKSTPAKRRLGAVGLHVAIRTVVSSRPLGRVVGQRPLAGVGVAYGSVVRLSVSRGKPPASAQPSSQVSVPDLMGELTDAAQQKVTDVGLAPNVVYVHSLQLVGTVIAQEPAAGSQVASGTQVTISISSGPGP